MRIRDISVGDQELSSHPNWSLTHVYINKNPLEGIRLLLNNEDVKIICTEFQLLLIVSWKYVDSLCNTFNIHYYRFLHSDFVEGVHAVLDAVSHHAQGVRADSNTRGDEITRMRSSDPRYCVAEGLAPWTTRLFERGVPQWYLSFFQVSTSLHKSTFKKPCLEWSSQPVVVSNTTRGCWYQSWLLMQRVVVNTTSC